MALIGCMSAILNVEFPTLNGQEALCKVLRKYMHSFMIYTVTRVEGWDRNKQSDEAHSNLHHEIFN